MVHHCGVSKSDDDHMVHHCGVSTSDDDHLVHHCEVGGAGTPRQLSGSSQDQLYKQ